MTSELVVTEQDGRPFTGLGSLVLRLIHPKTVGSKELGVSLCVMEPGGRVVRHRHAYEEAYYVLAGEGTMFLEDEGEIALREGMAVYIPSNRAHGQSAGDRGLRLLCALSPPPVEGELPEILE